eukprot:2967912-Pyramimonas_sp.AAC.1
MGNKSSVRCQGTKAESAQSADGEAPAAECGYLCTSITAQTVQGAMREIAEVSRRSGLGFQIANQYV